MTTTVAPAERGSHVARVWSEITRATVGPENPAVSALIQAYRDKYALGPRDRLSERADEFFCLFYRGRPVAVFGEKRTGQRMEVTDAYFDGSRIGKIAFVAECRRYTHRLQAGEYDQLVHSILFANADHWRAVVRDTGNPPYSLLFVHTRAEV